MGLRLKNDAAPGEGEAPLGGSVLSSFSESSLLFCPSWTMPPTVASSETLQCEGPISTRDSSCHAGDDWEERRDKDFHVNSYTFSKPFHLIVSYGEARRRPAPSPMSQTSPSGPTAPRKLALDEIPPSPSSARNQGALSPGPQRSCYRLPASELPGPSEQV